MTGHLLDTTNIVRGTFDREDDGVFHVFVNGATIPCDLLLTSATPLFLEQGNAVLVLLPREGEERGVILGRIAPPANPGLPDEITIKAGKSLTIECGEGSITLRGDGKVLIKGKDLVSRAQRMNRIKGGSVALN